jgi:hypothetical protein
MPLKNGPMAATGTSLLNDLPRGRIGRTGLEPVDGASHQETQQTHMDESHHLAKGRAACSDPLFQLFVLFRRDSRLLKVFVRGAPQRPPPQTWRMLPLGRDHPPYRARLGDVTVAE